MISVEEAKKIVIDKSLAISSSHQVPISKLPGHTLAKDVYSPIDLPPFNQSNVDGYAIGEKLGNNSEWKIVGEIKAGDHFTNVLQPGEACRIFTGAMVPHGAWCVLMQEDVTVKEKNVIFEKELLKLSHVRKKGSHIEEGALALNAGVFVNPAVVGFLASMGIDHVDVYRMPSVSLIITGNELRQPGSVLLPGQVYDSNTYTIKGAVEQMGICLNEISYIKDDLGSLNMQVHHCLSHCDVLLLSGGISVGDYDFVAEVMKMQDVETLFYKVAQKPGKPLFFGKKGKCYVFALPGNPASAHTCFYEYVYPCLNKLQHHKDLFIQRTLLPVTCEINKKKGLSYFLKASASELDVTPLDGQESFKIKSFAEANAFIYLSSEKENIEKGELVEVHFLPHV